jgi:hypothetical protein
MSARVAFAALQPDEIALVRRWHLADVSQTSRLGLLLTLSGHLRSRPSPGIHWAALPTSSIKSRKPKAPVHWP